MTLTLENVSKRVGAETHIDAASMALEPGETHVLLGPTLSGKTSLMRLMAGLDQPSSGRVLADGRDMAGVPVQQRGVAMVYQQFINYPTLSVYENIASPLRVARLARAEIDAKVREAAALLKLEPMLERTPLELSGGQQQRCALARALVKGAKLVLLDEPLANLDYKLREELRIELPRIFGQLGAILVYATTEPSEALLLGGRTATLHEGRITQYGPTVEVYRQPNSLITAQTFSDPPLNTVSLEKRGGEARLGEALTLPATGALAALGDGRYVAGLRPHHLALARPSPHALAIEARVAVTEITGSESFIHVDFGTERWVALAHGVHELEPERTVELWLEPERFLIFDGEGRLARAPALAGEG